MKKTKLLVLVTALLALSACGGKEDPDTPAEKEFKSNAEALGYSVSELEDLVLGDYDALYQLAAKITDPDKTDERYKAFAKAEYNLIYESALMLPWQQRNGTSATVAKTIPWQAGRASYGLTSDKFKNVVAISTAITKEQRAKVTAAYEAAKGTAPAHTADSDGWISLANDYSNPVAVDGKYTVGAGTANEIQFDIKNSLKTTYTKEPDKSFLNYLTNTWTYNSFHYTNMVDGLVENDKYSGIVGAIADKYKVEDKENGEQVWTFHIREGAKWVKNSDGSVVANVVADDFVANAEYVLNKANGAGAANMYTAFIKGAAAYYNSTDANKSFASVGIKAIDASHIQYTLPESTPYFITALTYSPYLPVNRAYLTSQGSDFGKDENHLLVNGAYRITSHETTSYMEYTKNAEYWDKDHVYLNTIRRQFIAGTKTSADVRKMYENGEIDSFTVNIKDEVGWETYVKGGPNGTGTQKNPAHPSCNATSSFGDATYFGYFNFNRSFWEVNDQNNAKDYDAKLATARAILNKNFRLGFLYGLKVEEALKMYSPDNPQDWLTRGYTNHELVSYNGKDYTDYVDDVYNRKQDEDVKLIGILNGSDPIYSPEKAARYFLTAKRELMASGVPASAFPIKIDVIGDMDVESQAYMDAMFRTVETNSNGVVKIQVNTPATEDQDTDWGSISCNYDFSMWSGWGPDYADPNTYLATLKIGGDMVEYLGFADGDAE